MPVYQQKNISAETQIGIWKIEETFDDLLILAKEKGINLKNLPDVNNPNRKLQWIATRIMSNELDESKIEYDQYGKPYLVNSKNISISHSGKFVAVVINSKKSCGVDIELVGQKVDRIKHKFLSQKDLALNLDQEGLTTYWAAKEALYKYYGKKEMLFIDHLFISNYTKKKNRFDGRINLPDFEVDLKLIWEKIEDYILVYTV